MRKHALSAIAMIEFFGGVFGIIIGLATFLQQPINFKSINDFLEPAILVALCLISAVSGWWLWKKDPRGLKWSKLVCGLQIPIIVSPLICYQFLCGLKLDTGIIVDGQAKGTFIGVNFPSFQLGNIFSVQWLPEAVPFPFIQGASIAYFLVNVNLVAVLAFYELVRAGRNDSRHQT